MLALAHVMQFILELPLVYLPTKATLLATPVEMLLMR
jgi:hypothetical protein